MNKIAAVYLLAIGAALAQPMNSVIDPPPVNANARTGLTHEEAMTLLKEAGFDNVDGLRLKDGGAWHGTALRNGQRVTVTIDMRGNITAGS